ADKGLGVVIMEPLRGGSLANPPAAVNQVFTEADENRTPVDWALQWLWNQPEVSVVLSGMSTQQQLEENINSAGSSGINSLNEEELATIKRARKEFEKLSPIGCTGCGYCMPCANGVHIPMNFDLYNEAHIYDQYEEKKNSYHKLDEKLQAGSCIACGECEPSCPQNLPIIELLKDVANYFS
ncbi:MAG: aldo/keto reductase, partial [Halanaerobiaceae bacterium]